MAPRRHGPRRMGAAADGPVLDLERYAPALLTFLANKLTHTASARYRREFGVGIIEWRIMALLAIEPGIPASRACKVIGLDKGPVSRTLAFLLGKGLVTADADGGDARRRLITLTPAGRRLHDRILPVALERERRLLSCLGPGEVEALLSFLNRLHANLGAVTVTAQAAERGEPGIADGPPPKPARRAPNHGPPHPPPSRRA